MESWRTIWREGFAKVLTIPQLEALRQALLTDDPMLIQGATTQPPPLMSVQDWPPNAACAVGYCGWRGDHLETVGEVEQFFSRACFDVDQLLGEPGACHWFLNWFDDNPREQVRLELLEEIELDLKQRGVPCQPLSMPVAQSATASLAGPAA